MFEVVQARMISRALHPEWTPAVGGQHTKATVQRDTSEFHGGSAALRVNYDFVGKRDYGYIQVNGAATFDKPGLGFGFWLKHDGTSFALPLRFTDASGEVASDRVARLRSARLPVCGGRARRPQHRLGWRRQPAQGLSLQACGHLRRPPGSEAL